MSRALRSRSGRKQSEILLDDSGYKDEIRAKLEDGVLTVTIPKYAKVESSRKIEIE